MQADAPALNGEVWERDFLSMRCHALGMISTPMRQHLCRLLTPLSIPAGHCLYGGGSSPGLFILLSGDVVLSTEPSHHWARKARLLERGCVFGEHAGGSEDAARETACADSASRLLLLKRKDYDAASELVPELAHALDIIRRRDILEADFIAALRRTRLFEHASQQQLAGLLHEAELETFDAGDEVLRQGEASRGVFYVAAGELHSRCGGPNPLAGGPSTLVDMLFPGDVFGDLSLSTGRLEGATVRAQKKTELMVVPSQLLDEAAPPASAREPSPQLSGPATVLMVATASPDLLPALSTAIDLLGQTLRSDYGSPVLVIRVVKDSPSMAWGFFLSRGGVVRIALSPSAADRDLVSSVRDKITAFRAWAAVYDRQARADCDTNTYVLIDTTAADSAAAEALLPLLTRLVFVSRDGMAEPGGAIGRLPTSHAAILNGPLPRANEPGYRGRAVRLRLDPTCSLHPDLQALGAKARLTFSRWGRAITDRRVGLALGGGGAWAYAHVALIEALESRGVPIDMVSGTSFGAVVGAYYCAAGLDGLAQLTRDARRLARSTQLAMLSSASLSHVIDGALAARRLDDLEVPLLPVATNLSTGAEFVPTLGTIGHGVRASGSFPGLFSATRTARGRLVDGAMVNNVPTSVLPTHGAFMTIASSVIAPLAETEAHPTHAGRARRLLEELSPVARVRDLVRSLFIMANTMGDADTADVTFRPPPGPFLPWDFKHAARIIELARERAEASADLANIRWGHLRRHAMRSERR